MIDYKMFITGWDPEGYPLKRDSLIQVGVSLDDRGKKEAFAVVDSRLLDEAHAKIEELQSEIQSLENSLYRAYENMYDIDTSQI